MNRRAFLEAVGALALAMGRGLVPELGGASRVHLEDASSAVGRVLALPAVRAFNEELDRLSGGTVPLHIRLEGEPAAGADSSSADRFWTFGIGESQPTHVVMFYRFAIDAFSGDVYYPDYNPETTETTMVPYADWVVRDVEAVA